MLDFIDGFRRDQYDVMVGSREEIGESVAAHRVAAHRFGRPQHRIPGRVVDCDTKMHA